MATSSLSCWRHHLRRETHSRQLMSSFAINNPKNTLSHETEYRTHGKQHLMEAGSREIQTHKGNRRPQLQHAASTPNLSNSSTASSPRFVHKPRTHRPPGLALVKSNGLTATRSNDLRDLITCDGHTDNIRVTTAHVRHRKSKQRLLPSSAPAVPMGNKPSSLSGSPVPDDNASLNSIVRRPVRVLRKSSNNLLKRLDAKSPLPRPLTATSILVTAHSNGEHTINPFSDPAHLARDSVIMLPSASTTTIANDSDGQPLSASTTVKETRRDSKSPYQAAVEDDVEDESMDMPPPVPTHRSSALSPTIPAPSPLPEDSPHKYGLKDHMDSPEPEVEPPVDINVNKARRRSSGLEIFTVRDEFLHLRTSTDSSQEAKTLQSASSFLNGLSTHRRRAESQNRTSETWATSLTGSDQLLRPVSRPGSARPPSAAQLNRGHGDQDGRRRGHNFKTNGFAYSRTLNITQLKCFRNHSRLLPSKNKNAPVECAMCHMDDEQDHWTCSWCAVRMCRYCRKTFAEGGITALRERVKQAESGGSPASSTESLGRGRSRAFV
ncbi:hypothetical protein LTR17_001431 [Elasticomyces elasticus]|nr:hypothetical protein LTR17_001431 [Elasticomyces elasticus]